MMKKKSEAITMSKKKEVTQWWKCIFSGTLFTNCRIAVVVEKPFMNPCWLSDIVPWTSVMIFYEYIFMP